MPRSGLAETIGLLAIVPSLLFVGVQLARGNREARAAALLNIRNVLFSLVFI